MGPLHRRLFGHGRSSGACTTAPHTPGRQITYKTPSKGVGRYPGQTGRVRRWPLPSSTKNAARASSLPLLLGLACESEVRDDATGLAFVDGHARPDLGGFGLGAGSVVIGEFVRDDRNSGAS